MVEKKNWPKSGAAMAPPAAAAPSPLLSIEVIWKSMVSTKTTDDFAKMDCFDYIVSVVN